MSHLDLFSMGGSDKADDDSSIGKYNSGLCYSMALALRNNVGMSVSVYHQEDFSESEDRDCETLYTLGTYNEVCEQTGKEKELIQITKSVSKQSFFSVHCDDYGGGEFDDEIIPTGYSVKLGVDWKLWMLLREIYSNMVDEGGDYYENICPATKYGTIFQLKFEEDSEFAEIWNNRHLYINEREPLYVISDKVEALDNEEGYLRIYKQNILVYKDETVPSKFAYNIKMGAIDERRILSDLWSVSGDITYAIKNTKNENYLRAIITADSIFKSNEFLTDKSVYGTASNLIHDIACEVYTEHGKVNSYLWLLNSIKERKDCGIGEKRIQSIGDSIYSYSNTVTVETTPEPFAEPAMEVEGEVFIDPFSAEIKKYYKFELDVEVRKAKLRGSKVIADKFEKCLIVDESFDLETDFPSFIIQYIDLTMEGNAIKNLGEYICKLLKR